MLANRTIGYARDEVQPVGLEGFYNKYLSGEEGKRLVKRLSGGTWIPVNDLTEIESKRGDDLLTTIDINIQDFTQNALLRSLKHHNARYGTAIVMEVKTGAIKAIANIGAANNGWWEDYNYAVGTATEPGSTFKLASVMSLFEDGYADLDSPVNINKGYVRYYNRDLHDSHPHDIKETDLRQAFEISSNVGISKLIQEAYGHEKKASEFTARLKQFGLHQTTGIEIPGEGQPKIKDAFDTEAGWSGTSLPWMSIGYELTLTPLQTLRFYNSVANDGRIMKPFLVDKIMRNGDVIKEFKPKVSNPSIASAETIRKAQELLEGVALRGTAKKHQSRYFNFAGKTGTAQIEYFGPDQNRKKYQASFAGYFPAEDPLYSCIVLVCDPKQNGYYGSQAALPVFKSIAEYCMAMNPVVRKTNLVDDAEKEKQTIPRHMVSYRVDVENILSYVGLNVENPAETEWVATGVEKDAVYRGREMEMELLPNLKGMGIRDAVYYLENAGYKVMCRGEGKVLRQSIKPGTEIRRGSLIELVLG
jgi:cell division protein FtsI (penicillin-binding protein 3)